jgi:hypothetical protein
VPPALMRCSVQRARRSARMPRVVQRRRGVAPDAAGGGAPAALRWREARSHARRHGPASSRSGCGAAGMNHRLRDRTDRQKASGPGLSVVSGTVKPRRR